MDFIAYLIKIENEIRYEKSNIDNNIYEYNSTFHNLSDSYEVKILIRSIRNYDPNSENVDNSTDYSGTIITGYDYYNRDLEPLMTAIQYNYLAAFVETQQNIPRNSFAKKEQLAAMGLIRFMFKDDLRQWISKHRSYSQPGNYRLRTIVSKELEIKLDINKSQDLTITLIDFDTTLPGVNLMADPDYVKVFIFVYQYIKNIVSQFS